MKTKRIGRIIVIVIICVLVIAIGALLGVANYLVGYAIGRSAGMPDYMVPVYNDSPDEETLRRRQAEEDLVEGFRSHGEIEKAEITSLDGLTLRGEAILSDPASHKWVITVHGYRNHHTGMNVIAAHYGQQGYNALMPDLRGCGESDGEFIGMGWPDRLDILGWIDWILHRDEEAEIVLHGISMGGATVMMTSGEELPPQVKAIVEDCGYTTVWDIFHHQIGSLHLPPFPLLNIANVISGIRAGYTFTEASALEQVKKAKVPMLFIHGAEDTFVNTEMVYPLYEACPSPKELLVVEGARHGNSYQQDEELYFGTVFQFLSAYVEEGREETPSFGED